MRKQFVYILLFFWGFHFLFPLIYQLFFGTITIYSDVTSNVGFWINSVFCLLVIFFLYCVKIPNLPPIEPRYNYVWLYYLISVILTLVKYIAYGGFEGSITGASHGTFIAYLTLFFSTQNAFFMVFFFQKKLKHIYWYVFSYIILLTMLGSRSAILTLLLVLLYLPLYKNALIATKKLKKVFLVFCFLSPLLFFYATTIRTQVNLDIISRLLVGRISMIELSSIPIEAKKDHTYDAEQFSEKYSFTNQLQQSLNLITPIDLFPYDVNPNQYYRSIFLGYSDDFVQNVYMSMNVTFPIFWIMSTNLFIGILLSITVFIFCFYILVKNRNNIVLFTILLCSIYEILYFFDLVMIVQRIINLLLTFVFLHIFEKICSSIVFTYKKYRII